jgi:hypothetical protein
MSNSLLLKKTYECRNVFSPIIIQYQKYLTLFYASGTIRWICDTNKLNKKGISQR